MAVVEKCTISGCEFPVGRHGLCQFHKWDKYRADIAKEFESKRKTREDNWKETAEKRVERSEGMFELYKNGKTLDEVGKAYGVSRERVRQCICHFPEYDKYGKKRATPREDVTCKNCKQIFKVLRSTRKNAMFCDKSCRILFSKKHKRSLKEQKEIRNKYAKLYYQRVLKNDPSFKEKLKERNKHVSQKRKLQKQQKREELLRALEDTINRNPKLSDIIRSIKNEQET